MSIHEENKVKVVKMSLKAAKFGQKDCESGENLEKKLENSNKK